MVVVNFRPPTALVAAVTCKASTERGGWSPAPIGQNIKTETYPQERGPGSAAAVGARRGPQRFPPGNTPALRRGRDRSPASGTRPSVLGGNYQVSLAEADVIPGTSAPVGPSGRRDATCPSSWEPRAGRRWGPAPLRDRD